jgi:hypothetical protein
MSKSRQSQRAIEFDANALHPSDNLRLIDRFVGKSARCDHRADRMGT